MTQSDSGNLPLSPREKRFAVAAGRKTLAWPHLATFLGQSVRLSDDHPEAECIVSCDEDLRVARQISESRGLPLWRLSKGFLRADRQDTFCVSLIVEDLAHSSRFKDLLHTPISEEQRTRVERVLEFWRAEHFSKFSLARTCEDLPEDYVLVVDQGLNDPSLREGTAGSADFRRMLDAALQENPDRLVLVGRDADHPDSGGHLHGIDHARVRFLPATTHLGRVISQAHAVYAVTSSLGFEAILWGKTVRTFGIPFYAGYGLTTDDKLPVAEGPVLSREKLAHVALIECSRYVDPETGTACEIEPVMNWLALQHRMRNRFPQKLYAVGFSRYKKPVVRCYFAGSEVRFVKPSQVPSDAATVVWGRRSLDDLPASARIIRLEDGFLRAVGIGVRHQPLSLVMDEMGIYFDPTVPSGLERILQETEFSDSLLARAQSIREQIIQKGISKYNVGSSRWARPANQQRVILVTGQIETDASIRYGAPGIKTNIELLKEARARNEDAYIIYKPHPYVAAGLRAGGEQESQAASYCNEIVAAHSIGQLLDCVDEVHVLTSLTGFEALLRGRKVTCYGHPFYAGWGLTTDVLPVSRRSRKLSLDELVAGSLILYPAYVSRSTQCFTTPERTIQELCSWKEAGEKFSILDLRTWYEMFLIITSKFRC